MYSFLKWGRVLVEAAKRRIRKHSYKGRNISESNADWIYFHMIRSSTFDSNQIYSVLQDTNELEWTKSAHCSEVFCLQRMNVVWNFLLTNSKCLQICFKKRHHYKYVKLCVNNCCTLPDNSKSCMLYRSINKLGNGLLWNKFLNQASSTILEIGVLKSIGRGCRYYLVTICIDSGRCYMVV